MTVAFSTRGPHRWVGSLAGDPCTAEFQDRSRVPSRDLSFHGHGTIFLNQSMYPVSFACEGVNSSKFGTHYSEIFKSLAVQAFAFDVFTRGRPSLSQSVSPQILTLSIMVPPTLDIHQHPALVESTSGDSESYSSDPDSPPPASPPSIVLTSFSHGCKPDLRLITSAYSPPSPGSKSSSPSISSEPPTPATQSGCSTESELLTPLSSQQDISPVFTSSASFTVPLYSHSASPHSSALPQSFRQSPVQPGSTPVTPTTLSPKRLCPEPSFRFPSVAPAVAPISRSRPGSTHPDPTSGSNLAPRVKISHPYARLYAKNSKEAGAAKRRRMWNHALEKSFFTPQEL